MHLVYQALIGYRNEGCRCLIIDGMMLPQKKMAQMFDYVVVM